MIAVRRSGRAAAAGVLLAAALAGCGGSGTSGTDVRPGTTIEYSPGLTEDLYLPAGATHAPLLVLVPGGGWETADPTGLAPLAARLAEAGVAAAPTHLRAAQDHVAYPVPVEDVLCAVASAAAEVHARGLAIDRVAVLGHSSGAHLAALAVLANRDYSPDCRAPAVIPDALVGLSGPYDIAQIPDIAMALLGSTPGEDPAAWAAANPVRRAGLRPQVPVLLLHGAADQTVPVGFTTQFAAALEAGHHATTVQIVRGADHQDIYQADVAEAPVARWLLGLPAHPARASAGASR